MITLNSVSRAVGSGVERRKLFEDLSLSISCKQLTVLIGRSGFGKSSLLELAALERRADSGKIYVDGQLVDMNSKTAVAKLKASTIGYVPQSPNLCEFMTVEQNLTQRIDLAGEDTDLYGSRIQELSERLRIRHLLKARVSSLSGGERYRVSLARVLITNPPILICDEPTAALDANTARDVISAVKAHAQSRNNLALVASHDRDLIDAADLVIDMEAV